MLATSATSSATPAARDPATLARELLAQAATAPDPAPLLEAARALLAQAKATEEKAREDATRKATEN